MRPAPRLFLVAILISAAIAVFGAGWEALRFGVGADATVRRLRDEVRSRVNQEAARVEALARAIARDGRLVIEAQASRDKLPALFTRLAELAGPAGPDRISGTVYVPSAGAFPVLAWSDGPAQNLTRDRLTGASALFVAPGTAGLRLVFVEPIDVEGRRVGAAAAEAVLASATPAAPAASFQLLTSYGAVNVDRQYTGASEASTRPNTFVVTSSQGAALLEVTYSPADLAAHRRGFRGRWVSAAGVPLTIALLLASGIILDRRRRAASAGQWLLRTAEIGGVIALATILAWLLTRLAGIEGPLRDPLLGVGALALVALGPVSWWWRRGQRRTPGGAFPRFVIDQLIGGIAVAAAVSFLAWHLSRRLNAASLDLWQFPLFPVDPPALLYLVGVLILHIAVCWGAASVLAIVARRWRLGAGHAAALGVAVILWLLPLAAVLILRPRGIDIPVWPAMVVAAGLATFALFATPLRRRYRHTTQAMRLILVFNALLLPSFSIYPMAAAVADRTAGALIEQDYAPATARHPEDLRTQLGRVEAEIDRLDGLAQYARTSRTADTQIAYTVWRQTSLADTRVTSDVEIYGADRGLVSRFALNLPEYIYRASVTTWQGHSCGWEEFGEDITAGAHDRRMLHAERGICDANGVLVGGIVIHIAQRDYQALPFVSTANPYYEIVSATSADSGSRLADLQVVVYGWSLQPTFTSGRNAWPISETTFKRLYQSRDPFWLTLPAENRNYRVYFSQDRGGVYALGYPEPTLFEHAARLAEVLAVTAVLFVAIQVGALAVGPFARRTRAPLRVLFHEIRTSFYRKLFLFFVLAAVVPVLLFALAFGAYMTAKFRADVQSEAQSVVLVARRVLEELAAALRPEQRAVAPTDDVMVWIRQVIDQDVNVFEGSELVATSQRDLFDSGLLPTRTPASVYREVVLNRLPTLVVEDRLRSFPYLVAAAPVAVPSRDMVLSLPLANRQVEIEREIDTLNRGVLVGAVLVVLFAAALGASVAGRIADPVARLTRATRLIAAGKLDVRVATDTADELRRLVDDFNSMAATLLAQRAELARTHQLKAWSEMARQVAHEIKNPLTPIQLAAEHLDRVHQDRGQPLGPVVDQCIRTILGQVRLLRQIASEFSNFAGTPAVRLAVVPLEALLTEVVNPYRLGLASRIALEVDVPSSTPAVVADRTLLARALTNLVENAVQAMPEGGRLTVTASPKPGRVVLTIADTGVGMDETAIVHAFEPYFSTKTGGSGLGLANAKRNIELSDGTISIASRPGEGTAVTVTLPAAPPGAIAAG